MSLNGIQQFIWFKKSFYKLVSLHNAEYFRSLLAYGSLFKTYETASSGHDVCTTFSLHQLKFTMKFRNLVALLPSSWKGVQVTIIWYVTMYLQWCLRLFRLLTLTISLFSASQDNAYLSRYISLQCNWYLTSFLLKKYVDIATSTACVVFFSSSQQRIISCHF